VWKQIAWFEIRFWLRSWMLWIFVFIIGSMALGATSVDGVFGAFSNAHRNAPLAIENFYAYFGLFTVLMSMAFVNSAATRDFSCRTHEIIFSTPLRQRDFLLGRFLGATLISTIPMLGISAGILLAKLMPWVDPGRFGRVDWRAHLQAIFIFALPNTIFVAAILFTIAVLARNEIASFAGAVAVIVGYVLSRVLLTGLEREAVAALLDPFGGRALAMVTRYWTAAELSTRSVGLDGILAWNRLLWLSLGGAMFVFACSRFSFAERRTRNPNMAVERSSTSKPFPELPSVHLLPSYFQNAPWPKFVDSVKIHWLGILHGPVFIVVMLLGLLTSVVSLVFGVGAAVDCYDKAPRQQRNLPNQAC
jgi:ABC-2 type transport system permease protein